MTDRRRAAGRAPIIAIAVAGYLLRLVMVFAVHPSCPFDADRWADKSSYAAVTGPATEASGCSTLTGDSLYIYVQGRMLAAGKGFADPVAFLSRQVVVPSGKKAPATTVIVAALDRAGFPTIDASRAVLALLGSGAIVVVGLLARRLAGRRAGILAASIMALYPVFVINDWRLMTESWTVLWYSAMVYAIYRLWERATPGWAVLVGVFTGLCYYGRAEMMLVWAFAYLPAILGRRHVPWRARLLTTATTILAGLAVMMPLIVANTVRFSHPVPLGPGTGWGIRNGTCDEAWFGEQTGYLSFNCFDNHTTFMVAPILQANPLADETDVDPPYRERAVEYIRDNLPRYPAVAAARVGRVFGFFEPVQTIELERVSEGRGDLDSMLQFVVYYLLVPFTALGAWILRRRRVPISPILGPLGSTVLIVAASFGLPRYRLFVDVGMVVASAVAFDALPRWWRARRSAVEAPWWSAPDGSWAPPVARAAATAARAPVPRVPRALVVVVLVLAVLGAGVVAWSSTVEPYQRPTPSDPAERQALCNDLRHVEALAEGAAKNPSLLGEFPPVLLRIDDRAAGSLHPQIDSLLGALLAFDTVGRDASKLAAVTATARTALEHIHDYRVSIC